MRRERGIETTNEKRGNTEPKEGEREQSRIDSLYEKERGRGMKKSEETKNNI